MGPDERHTSTYLFYEGMGMCKIPNDTAGSIQLSSSWVPEWIQIGECFFFSPGPVKGLKLWKIFIFLWRKPCWMWSGSECQKARTLTLASHVAWENVGIWSCIKDKLAQKRDEREGKDVKDALIIHHNLRWPGNADSCFTFGPATPLCLFWTLWSQKWSEQANPEVKTNAGSFGHWSCRFEGAFPEKERNW